MSFIFISLEPLQDAKDKSEVDSSVFLIDTKLELLCSNSRMEIKWTKC
jgi:hypothetical protein